MLVSISARAEADLEEIGDFIAADNPDRALSYVDELRAACAGLAETPYRFALLDRLAHIGYRRRPYGQYAIIYVVGATDIVIVRVLSSARDLNLALDLN